MHNDRLLQTQKLAPPPYQKPTFESFCVYKKFEKDFWREKKSIALFLKDQIYLFIEFFFNMIVV